MKQLFCFWLLTCTLNVFCQSTDSLLKAVKAEQDAEKRFTLCEAVIHNKLIHGNTQEIPPFIERLFRIAAQQNNDSLIAKAYYNATLYFDVITNTKEALEYLLKAKDIAEKKYPSMLSDIYLGLAATYHDVPDPRAALKYISQCLAIVKQRAELTPQLSVKIYAHFGLAYLGLNKLDSALYYCQQANTLLMKDSTHRYRIFNHVNTAMVYSKLRDFKLAEYYFTLSIDSSVNKKRDNTDASAFGKYSLFLLEKDRLREAVHYGRIGYQIAQKAQAKLPLLDISNTLRRTYEKLNHTDSSYYFAKLELDYRDSLFNQQQINAVQNLKLTQVVKENEQQIKDAEIALQRRHNLQYAAIALGVLVLVIGFLVFSFSVLANAKLIRFLGVVSLLIVFEFLNLLLHPYLGKLTHHSPLLMLLIMVCVAALLVPLHHRLEHWITNRLVEKNNKIRLAAAKRTIQELEGPGAEQKHKHSSQKGSEQT